jgi:hypothetical protein
MKAAVLTLCVWAIVCPHGAGAAETAATVNERGYKECDLKHLSSCRSTNQLIWSLGASVHRKAAFDRALREFLRNAPKIHELKYSWSAAEIARDSLTGPSGTPTKLGNGDWFFQGFTPHDAPDCAAIVFDPNGAILLVATLNSADTADSTSHFDPSHHLLTIYSHRNEPSAQVLLRVHAWAEETVAEMGSYPGLPKNLLVGTRILTQGASDGRWETRWLDR